MSETPDPQVREALAGMQVLGVLEPAVHAALATRAASDPDFRGRVEDWERRLAPLHALVPEEAPPAALWQRIAADTIGAASGPAAGAQVIDFEQALAARTAALRTRLNRWRIGAIGAGALAASIALAALVLPARLVPPAGDRFVGIVNAGGAMPNLVVTVDLARGELKVRPLGLAAEAGKSHELWAVRGSAAPVSLGLVDAAGAQALKALPAALWSDPQTVLAVSVEPAGGSPTGQPTGPVVFTGKLIRDP